MNSDLTFGTVTSFYGGVGTVSGLVNVSIHELVEDEKSKKLGLIVGFGNDQAEVVFFNFDVSVGTKVRNTGELFTIKISDNIDGRYLNGLGNPIDGLGPIKGKKYQVFNEAPPIIERQPVNTPLTTGIKVIDTVLPLGRGQRELIIGDRKLGKTTLALDTVVNQKKANPIVHCIYVLVGQKTERLRELISTIEKNNAQLYTSIVAATATDSLAEQYLAPFVGCTIGEYFRNKGEDALIIYDDLSKHAKNYRNISLLLRRPAGRETYPGDIFSLHAKLLERAGRMSVEKGGGSLTALPIIETQEGDITEYIPTNLISITDGQIYFERGLFQKGILPAVNVGLSVSRVGGQAQPEMLQKVTGGIRLSLSQHKELVKLAQLETDVSGEASQAIVRGELLVELLKQKKHTFVSWEEQALLFYVFGEGQFDNVPSNKWVIFEDLFGELVRSRYGQVLKSIGMNIEKDNLKTRVSELISDFNNEFVN